MGDPIPSKWLSEVFEQFIEEAPPLLLAYDYPNYPGDLTGHGRWVDLYLDAARARVIGRLWTDDEIGCGIEQLPGRDADSYTREVLLIRSFHHYGREATSAFDEVASRYHHGPIHTGDLSAAIPRS